jgi:hypothetical protein
MDSLDNELVPILHKAASMSQYSSGAVLELIFHIMLQWQKHIMVSQPLNHISAFYDTIQIDFVVKNMLQQTRMFDCVCVCVFLCIYIHTHCIEDSLTEYNKILLYIVKMWLVYVYIYTVVKLQYVYERIIGNGF